MNRGRFLERYLAGECLTVWAELVALGAEMVGVEEEAVGVAREMMSRVSANLDALIPKLREIGFRFGRLGDSRAPKYWCGNDPVRTLPDRHAALRIGDIQRRTGRMLPLSLRTFWEQVGGVNLVGFHPEWPFSVRHLDPLFCYPCLDSLIESLDEGETELPLAPDDYHKDDTSGGPAYAVDMPLQVVADGLFLYEWQQLHFVDYLRSAFHWGGFPGLGRCRGENLPRQHIMFLRSGLAPF